MEILRSAHIVSGSEGGVLITPPYLADQILPKQVSLHTPNKKEPPCFPVPAPGFYLLRHSTGGEGL